MPDFTTDYVVCNMCMLTVAERDPLPAWHRPEFDARGCWTGVCRTGWPDNSRRMKVFRLSEGMMDAPPHK